MKIITMCKLIEDGEPLATDDYTQPDPRDWFCVIETKEEEMVYDEYLEHPDQYEFLWNAMVKHAGLGMGVSWGDDDMYGYIRPDEVAPEIGEEYTDGDNDVWVRTE